LRSLLFEAGSLSDETRREENSVFGIARLRRRIYTRRLWVSMIFGSSPYAKAYAILCAFAEPKFAAGEV
jgi:hypothetical protein